MMGTKERTFQPLPNDISLEDVVPEDNFYRRLQERLDLFFVRELQEFGEGERRGAANRLWTEHKEVGSGSGVGSTEVGTGGGLASTGSGESSQVSSDLSEPASDPEPGRISTGWQA